MIENQRCIYCKQMKDKTEFNREHVVPQMMGTYKNSLVLSDFQVCQECNSYFSSHIENKIALDSYEAFLRMQHKSTRMSDGRKLIGKNIRISGAEGKIKGIHFSVVSDKSNPYHMRFEPEPMVGIIHSYETQEYNYYTLEELPDATEEVKNRMKCSRQPIINTGINKDNLERALTEKGYVIDQYTYSVKNFSELTENHDILTSIDFEINSIIRRVCAKTVFNYLCYSKGKEFVLNSIFDVIREYIRYGNRSEQLWFRVSRGPVSIVKMPNDTAHVVGYMWNQESGQWTLCGCLTWFGNLTYIFKLGDAIQKVQLFNLLYSTKMACFNNVDCTITEDDAVYIYDCKE